MSISVSIATTSVIVTLLVCSLVAPGIVMAQYPEKPITIIAGYGAGSAGDQILRSFADVAKKYLGSTIIVVNRPGAGGTDAIASAIAAKPDGYTLGGGTTGTLTLQPHETSLSYGGPDTYTPVAKLVTQPNVLMVRAGARWTTAQQFLDDARTHPGQLTVGVPGRGTTAHANVEQLKRIAKADLKVVFFDGPKQVEAVLAGQIDASIAPPGPTMPHVKAGQSIALGVFAERRIRLAPDVPTFKELGFDVTLQVFQAIIAPRDTPASIVRILDDAIRKIVSDPVFISVAEATESTVDYEGSIPFAAELRRAFDDNGKLIEVLGMTKK